MTAPTLRSLVRTVGSGPVVDALKAWGVNGGTEQSRPRAVRALLERWRDEQALQSRLTDLPKKLADLLDGFLDQPNRLRAAQEIFKENTEVFRSRYEVDAALAALHREGLLFPLGDAPLGERDYAVPAELADAVLGMRRRQRVGLLEVFTLKGHLHARHFARNQEGGGGDTKAEAEKAEAHARRIYKFYLMEDSLRGRVRKLPDPVREVFLRALTVFGGVLPVSQLESEFPGGAPDVDLIRKCFEDGMLGTVAPLSLARFGIADEAQAVLIFHEVVLLGLPIYSNRHAVDVDAALSAGVDLITNLGRFLREGAKGDGGKARIQLTQDGQLYKASAKRIAKDLLPIPGGTLSSDETLQFLFRFAVAKRLVERGGDRALRVTEAAQEFEGRPLIDKLRALVSFAVEDPVLPGERFHQVRMRRLLVRMLKRSAPERWHEVMFLPFLARNAHLTQLGPQSAEQYFAPRFKGGGYTPTEDLGRMGRLLLGFVKHRLHPLGIVDLGVQEGRVVALRLSRLGAELLGTRPAGQLMAERSSIVVNPDCEVILFPGDDEHDAVHTLDRFMRRMKTDHIHHFQLEPEAVHAGLKDGLTLASMVAELTDRSRAPLPQNVLYSLEEWADRAGLLTLQQRDRLRAGRAATIDTVMEVPQMQPYLRERQDDTSVTVDPETPWNRLEPLLRDRGLLLDTGGQAEDVDD